MARVIYEFKTKEDFIDYLGLIIEHLQKCLWRIKRYNKKIEDICLKRIQDVYPKVDELSLEVVYSLYEDKEFIENKSKIAPISYYKYIELDEMIKYVELKILNLIGDRTKDAVSYIKFRTEYKKFVERNSSVNDNTNLTELPLEITEKINQCYKARNFGAHLGDSNFIAQKKYKEQQLADFKSKYGLDVSSSVYKSGYFFINRYEYVEFEWLLNTYVHTKNNISIFSSVFQQIRRDYQHLVGRKVTFMPLDNRILPFDYNSISAESIDLQFNKKKK